MSLSTQHPRNQILLKHDLDLISRGNEPLAGVDEAGRGPLAGPVLTAAVIVKDAAFTVRIDDSKKLTEKNRVKAFDEIQKQCVVSVTMRSPEVIDTLNIRQATLESMEEAVRLLGEAPKLVIVDGPMPLRTRCPIKPIIKGDSISLAIACASIVCKVTRDRIMAAYHKKYPEYGFDRHKGYGTKTHMDALKKYGPCPIHRKSFEPVASAGRLN